MDVLEPATRCHVEIDRETMSRMIDIDELRRSDYPPEISLRLLDGVIEEHPDFVDAYQIRAAVARDQKRFDAALADHARAIALRPDDPFAFYNRALTRRAAGNLTDAIADVSRSIAIYAREPDFFRLRGDLFEKRGMREEASADYRMALTLDPAAQGVTDALERMGAEP